MLLTTSKKLIKNTNNFYNPIKKYFKFSTKPIKNETIFLGWGRKNSGQNAIKLANTFECSYLLLEDGFIRSLGLGVENSPSFSLVSDNLGIYYDATAPSALEEILNHYDFKKNLALLETAKKAINLIITHNISKYNHTPNVPPNYFTSPKEKILIISQTSGDLSLKYGLGDKFSTKDLIDCALQENQDKEIYLKIHPDVLSGKKTSDINPQDLPSSIKLITEDFNPISLLKHFKKVYTKTSQMGFEALMVGCECVCFGMPFYAGWGLTKDKQTCPRRTKIRTLEEVFAASYILYSTYYNPIYQRKSDILDTLETIISYKYLALKNNNKAFFFGFSIWKHGFIPPFLKEYKKENLKFINPIFSTPLKLALKKGLDLQSEIFIWGRKEFREIEEFAKTNNLRLTRVEDGFIRSISLGSDLTRPYSQSFDTLGIYFDPTQSSALEEILNNHNFSQKEILEAKILKEKILKTKISKYNTTNHKTLNLPQNKTKILVIGQVEDDASVRYGAKGATNLSLLKQAREENKDAFILYKPHPDVLSGNRIGNIPTHIAKEFCDELAIDISLASCLEAIDQVHTLTSLSGFEALVYGKKVVTYGLPFYAGWGLTEDKQTCPRRTKIRTLEELIAATYILYPRYIHPKTLEYCHPLALLEAFETLKEDKIYNFKMSIYTFFTRNGQKIFNSLK
ncbi:capsule biosynthesis protein [Helicobacter valdiviensis]|uniref:Capsule biosynthesis protein n=1 Tax=Helicobacter valdiviensis TaxID=1458358 RepID=A0A2W6MUL9_9HELI|nr:capsular polysaccharide biosynthesis protein [Helicobacter valdiviensis]PZT47651.1 capsule biosynthesis protein [Helicobacter valdiviensis]